MTYYWKGLCHECFKPLIICYPVGEDEKLCSDCSDWFKKVKKDGEGQEQESEEAP